MVKKQAMDHACSSIDSTPVGVETLKAVAPYGVVWGNSGIAIKVANQPILGSTSDFPFGFESYPGSRCISETEFSGEAEDIVKAHNLAVIRAYDLGRKSVTVSPPTLAHYYRGVIYTVCEGFNISSDTRKVLETALWYPPKIEYDTDDDAFITNAVDRAKVHCVHPESATTIGVGRAVLAAEREKKLGVPDPIFPIAIESDEQLMDTVSVCNKIADIVGDTKDHPLSPIFAVLMNVVGDYERDHVKDLKKKKGKKK